MNPGRGGAPEPLEALVVLTWRMPATSAAVVEAGTLAQDTLPETLRTFQAALEAKGVAYIATCQRIIWAIQPARSSIESTLRGAYLTLARPLPEAERYEGFAAFRHLAEVAASMDALVPGEPQVLGQVRSAVKTCDDAGVLGTDLRHVFDLVLRTAKSVRAKTRFFEGKVSILPLAADVLGRAISTRPQPSAAVLGTGEMATKAGRMIQRMAPNCRLHVVSHDCKRAAAAAMEFGAAALSLEDFLGNPPAIDAAVLAMEAEQ